MLCNPDDWIENIIPQLYTTTVAMELLDIFSAGIQSTNSVRE